MSTSATGQVLVDEDGMPLAGYVVVVAKAPAGHGHHHRALHATIELPPAARAVLSQAPGLQVTLVPVGTDGRAPPTISFRHRRMYLTAE